MNTALSVLGKLAELSRISLSHLDSIAASVQTIQLAAGECAFRQGDLQPYIYVVRSGLLKQYYTDEDGNTCIKSFTDEGVVFACLEALDGAAATFSSEAIEPSVVERVPFRIIRALADEHMEWLKAVSVAYAMLARIKVRRERDLLLLTAEELYEQFVATSPSLAERVPQKDLAGYFGVTPVGLNRIVKRCRAKQERSA